MPLGYIRGEVFGWLRPGQDVAKPLVFRALHQDCCSIRAPHGAPLPSRSVGLKPWIASAVCGWIRTNWVVLARQAISFGRTPTVDSFGGLRLGPNERVVCHGTRERQWMDRF